jgi:uncharacterized radical SAM superfamily Fe-S cluster-containing enzyme
MSTPPIGTVAGSVGLLPGGPSQSAREEVALGVTESLCPWCLERITARRVAVGDDVYLEKRCPEHGGFRTILWRGPPSYSSWAGPARRPSAPPRPATRVGEGCPFDCGLCPDHRQHTCCVVLEVTQRCDLGCPFCFASSRLQDQDPDLAALERRFRSILSLAGPCNVQLSGGEPTLRDDLPEIVALGRSLGFGFIQLNTNGLRLARDARYVRRLKEAGLGCVFLQFDGVDDAVHQRIRGARLLAAKTAAIARCAEARLGVILVPTLVPGVNTDQMGAILSYGLERAPVVRGVHFQPVSYFGRFPGRPTDAERITLPEVMTGIEAQTGGSIRVSHFHPPSAENAHCSFQGNFFWTPGGTLKPSPGAGRGSCCATPGAAEAPGGTADRPEPTCCRPRPAGEDARTARDAVARRWAYPEGGGARRTDPPGASRQRPIGADSLDAFLEQATQRSFGISGMAFQDAWNIDLDRLRDCFLHVAGADARIVPFCAYNLTDALGDTLYR